jgi:spore coat polysaccharide biosynthesis protein SpsF
MANAAIVLQARMGSTRLPGKVLAPLAGRSVLAHCIERLRHHAGLPVIVATTTLAEDDRVADEAVRMDAAVVRGAVGDVLGRYVQAAAQYSLDELVRATADNPAVDMDAPIRTLELLRRSQADHVVEFGLPYGAAVEAVSVEALQRAHTLATEPEDREHVTTFIRRDPRFLALPALAPSHARRALLRLTIDTPADLAYMRRLYSRLESASGAPVSLAEIIETASRMLSVPSVDEGVAALDVG